MIKHRDVKARKGFTPENQKMSPNLVLGLVVLTLGLYVIAWFYEKNKELLQFDEHAPQIERCITVLVVVPFIWILVSSIFKYFTGNESTIVSFISLGGYVFVAFLITKYYIDFIISFSNITKSPIIIWIITYFFGLVSIISIFMQVYYLIPFIFFFIISIPAMQAEMNQMYFHYFLIREKNNLYH